MVIMGCHTSPPFARRRVVIDPVWKLIDFTTYQREWQAFLRDAHHAGFIGLDLEWTTQEIAAEDDGANTADSGSSDRARRKARRYAVGPVATVQLSTSSITFVIKYSDVNRRLEASHSTEHTPEIGSEWVNYRIGAKHNDLLQLTVIKQNLLSLLADGSVVKVGVSIRGDQAKFQADYPGSRIVGCVDLVVLANHYIYEPHRVPPDFLKTPFASHCPRSLKDMCALFAGWQLDKNVMVVKSDWGGQLGALSPLQVAYAAADAEASFDVGAGVLRAARLLPSTAGEKTRSRCSSVFTCVVDREPPVRHTKSAARAKKTALLQCGCPEPAAECVTGQTSSPAAAAPRADVHLGWCKGRSKPYYDNINVYDPQMNLVFTVDRSKAHWYAFRKQLAEVVEWREPASPEGRSASSGPSTRKEIAAIRLSFTPDHRKYNDAHIRRNGDYFRQPKENQCVVCGQREQLVRFAVIPLMYRKFFPSVYMSHNSYDLLLLCTTCFARSRVVYDAERERVAEDFAIPLTNLTPAGLQRYCESIEVLETSCSSNPPVGWADTDAHHVHPRLRLKAMREFSEIQHHREIIITILKHAKALSCHYAALDDQAAPVTGSDAGQPGGTPCAGGQGADGSAADRRSLRAKANQWCPSAIPEARLQELRAYVTAHASRYPFWSPGGRREDQARLFAQFGPASREGVRFILGEHVARSYRGVLTHFWVLQHPELLDILGPTTRREERGEHDTASHDTAQHFSSSEVDDETLRDLPCVDSHGFLVVKLLLEKYRGTGHAVVDEGKSAEHAVGQFIYRWRRRFLESMNPEYLPLGWVAEDGILR